MINLIIEHVESLAALARALPPGRLERPTHPGTLMRWARRGLRGVRLEVIRVGGRTCSSVEALQRFFDALASPETVSATPAAGVSRRGLRAESAARELERLGM